VFQLENQRMISIRFRFFSDKCLNSFDILVTDDFDRTNWSKNKFKLCQKNSVPFGSAEVRIIHCVPGLKGRYIVIRAPGKYPLTLCEVKAYPQVETGKFSGGFHPAMI
jgi:hypothetical protein